MKNRPDLKWYQRPTPVILLLIFFFPVGLYFMWKYEIWSASTRWIITGAIAFVIITNSGNEQPTTTDSASLPVETIDATYNCLADHDWVYPSSNNPTAAWNFSSDGTFMYSTTFFDGLGAWGNWEVLSPGQVKISYTLTTDGSIPADKTFSMISCNSLRIGGTLYSKE